MLPLCSRSRPSAPSSLSEWQCVRGCSDAMRNFLGRSARPCTSPQRACLAQTRACALDARTRVLRNSKSSRQSVLAPLEIGRVRALARGPAASLVLLCVRFWPGLQVIHVGRSSRHGWQTRARPGCRSVLRLPFGDEISSSYPLPSGIHDALYREGVGGGGGWPLRVNVRGNNRRESVDYYNRFMNTELNTGVPVEFRVEPVAKPKGSMGFSPAGCPNASLKWLPHAGHSF